MEEAKETGKEKEEETKIDGDESVMEIDPDVVVTEPPPAPVIEPIDLEAEENESNENVPLENAESKISMEEDQELVTEMERIEQPLKKIRIKEEPLDEVEVPEEEEFIFTNLTVKQEPIEPEPGKFTIFFLIFVLHNKTFIKFNFTQSQNYLIDN